MAFNQPPNTPPAPQGAPQQQPVKQKTLAQASAAGTATTAPTTSFGERLQNAQQSAPPAGVAQNHPVAPHAGQQSVGTHKSADPNKRANPVHGWGS